MAHCPHCGTAVEGSVDRYCCGGCEVAAEIIAGAGLERYYRERSEYAPRPDRGATDWSTLSTTTLDDGSCEASFRVDGLRCASCTWLTEHVLERTEGVQQAQVSYGSGRATVRFDPDQVQLSQLCERVSALGYSPRPTDAPDQGDRSLLVRLGLAAFVAINVMAMSASLYLGWIEGMHESYAQLFRWAQLLLVAPAVTWAAGPFFSGAWQGIKRGVAHMDLPIAVAVAVLFVHGAVSTVLHVDAYLDSLSMLIALLLAGRFLEARGRKRAMEAASALAARLPSRARMICDGGVVDVAVQDLEVGDHIEVGSGEEVAADGVVTNGTAMVQMALITGEAEPIEIEQGQRVVAGALVQQGALTICVQAVGARTVGARMAEQLSNAEDRSEPTAADRLAPWFVGGTLVVAVLCMVVWTWFSSFDVALGVTVAVLVTACPCALGLSGPLANAAGLAASARRGVVLGNANALRALANVDVVALDKTGTLTAGTPQVVQANDAVLRLAAGLERHSAHPVARAILHEAMVRGIPLPLGQGIQEQAGVGIEGMVDEHKHRIRSEGPGRVVVQRLDGERWSAIGNIQLRDVRREDAARAVDGLANLGIEATLLTGDRIEVAEAIGRAAHVPTIHASMLPEDKVSWVQSRQDA
ncbi:MAG: Cu2+-exporting ATPase, partial [Kiritimatiellia bacterium]